MDFSITARKTVQYPTVADTTIKVGDRVRSYDFKGQDGCYFVGTVTNIRKDTEQYDIAVEYQVWMFEREASNYCASVHPPVNGTPSLLGGVHMGVQRVLEGEEL